MTNESLNGAAAQPSEGGNTASEVTKADAAEVAKDEQAELKTDAQAPAEGEAKPETDPKTETADANYEIKFSEGFTPDAELLEEFVSLAKEAKLPGEAVQKIAGLSEKMMQRVFESQVEALNTRVDEWEKAVKADKDLGGDKLEQSLAVAKKAFDAVVPEPLKPLFERFDREKNPQGQGLGSHPDVIRMFIEIGKSISEDNRVVGATNSPGKRTHEERLYGNKKS